MIDFKKILVAYDASGYSERAFKKALEIAEKEKSEIILVTVITGVYHPAVGFTTAFAEEVIEKQERFLQKMFSRLESIATKKGVKMSFKFLHDPSVAKAIIEFVKSNKIDLVVIGSHGRSGFNKLVLGSVAHSVLHQVKCSVMVVK